MTQDAGMASNREVESMANDNSDTHIRGSKDEIEENIPDIPDENERKWLNAYYDPVANLHTFTQCICLSDIHADGDNKLIMADIGSSGQGQGEMKLKVYKGTTLLTENSIIDLPTGVVTFYMDATVPKTAAIAVASGPYIYVYKNLRPYFKFTLPSMDINPQEQDLWNQIKNNKIDVNVLREMIEQLRAQGAQLTVRSLKLLQTRTEDCKMFVNVHKETPLKRQTVITCLDTLKKSLAEEDAISCLVLGTESKQIYVLDPEAFTVLTTMDLPAVPVFLSVSGLFDVEFRVVVACRNGSVYNLKRGSKSGKVCFELNSQPVGLARVNKNIVVACMDDTLNGFTSKGKKLWTVRLPGSVTTMELMDNKHKGYKAVIVALTNLEVHIYQDKYLVNTFRTEDIVTGLRFGRFGREDATLVMTTKGGGLLVKMLRRTAMFEEKDILGGPPAAQGQKLNVPKKTKLFVDQTMRERENSVSMHRQFQHDLYRLRLQTARSYVDILENSITPISTSTSEPLKLNAQVQGIGPTFKLTVNLQNTSLTLPILDMIITFQYDDKMYRLQKTIISVPMLVPGLNYAFETFIECIHDKAISDTIKVYVMKKYKCIPIITALISMPVSESMVVV